MWGNKMSTLERSTQATLNYSTTTNIWDEDRKVEMPTENDNLGFIFVPLAVLITVMFLSAMVYLMARNRRRITNFYKRVYVPTFTFDPSDLEDNEDPTECLLKGKLHIDNSFDQYQIPKYNDKRELYT